MPNWEMGTRSADLAGNKLDVGAGTYTWPLPGLGNLVWAVPSPLWYER